MGDEKPNLAGSWTSYSQEHLDEFLAAQGVPWIARKMATSMNSTFKITQEGDEMSIEIVSRIMTKIEKFKIGEEFETTQPDKSKHKGLASWEGDMLVIQYTPMEEGKGKPAKTTRRLTEAGEMEQKSYVDDVVATRMFRKNP